MLQSADNDYESRLRSIYNINSEDEIDYENDPFFAAMKIPKHGEESATDPDRTTEKPEIDIDQGGD